MKTTNPNTVAPRLRSACTARLLLALLLLALPVVVQAQDYSYETYDGAITITGYFGPGRDVTIPDTIDGLPVTSIGDWAFDSNSVTNFLIPDSVTNIGSHAFSGCSDLTSITIGNGVTSIGSGAFSDCQSLTVITVGALNPVFIIVDGILFNKSQTALILCPPDKAGSYTVPSGVTNIGQYAFSGCWYLTSVTIPSGVISIEDWAFLSCSSVTNFTIPNTVTSIGEQAFDDCESLTSITIPSSVTNLGFGAFAFNYRLTSVTILSGVINIGIQAFCYCGSLTGVYFIGNAPGPGTDSSVFDGDPATVYYLPGTTNWGATFDGRPAVLWNPQAQTGDASFGVQTNQFGFNITGTADIPFVVESCTNLANPIWTPLQSCTLTNGSLYFSDPDWTNYPSRFYRLRSP